jgi:hypothetical protein
MDWVQLVSNYGFPIVVSLYLLIKTQQKLEEVSMLLTRIQEILKLDDMATPAKPEVKRRKTV